MERPLFICFFSSRPEMDLELSVYYKWYLVLLLSPGLKQSGSKFLKIVNGLYFYEIVLNHAINRFVLNGP